MNYITEIENLLTKSPLFGLALTIFAYGVGVWMGRRIKISLVNPMLVALLLIVGILMVFHIPYEHYATGGDVIELFLAPVTAVLAVKIYQQFQALKTNWFPILVGCAAGAATSLLCVTGLCRLFFIEEALMRSMLPKSVTTAIAIPLSEQFGGFTAVTVAAVVLTGMTGVVVSPLLIRLLKIQNPVEAGIAIGTSSHALGTAKAIQMGDMEGAMSSIALGISGLMTVVYVTFFS